MAGRSKAPTKPKKSKASGVGAQDELKRLIKDQRQDANGHGPGPEAGEESLVTQDGAIRANHEALRALVAPAPDEVLTTPPMDDSDEP